MSNRKEVAALIRELRNTDTPNLTTKEKNRAIRANARQYDFRRLESLRSGNGGYDDVNGFRPVFAITDRSELRDTIGIRIGSETRKGRYYIVPSKIVERFIRDHVMIAEPIHFEGILIDRSDMGQPDTIRIFARYNSILGSRLIAEVEA